jgi:hypothetical protein
MNPGPVEEVGKTATALVDSLKSTPVILALVVFNIIYVGFGFYTQIQQGKRFSESQATWERMVDKAMAFCPSAEIRKPQQ